MSEELENIDRHERSIKDNSYDKATLRRWIAEAEEDATIEGIKLGVGASLTLLGAAVGAILYIRGKKKQRAADEAQRLVGS